MASKKMVHAPAPELVEPLRCWRCDKQLAEIAVAGTGIRCMRCGAKTKVPA